MYSRVSKNLENRRVIWPKHWTQGEFGKNIMLSEPVFQRQKQLFFLVYPWICNNKGSKYKSHCGCGTSCRRWLSSDLLCHRYSVTSRHIFLKIGRAVLPNRPGKVEKFGNAVAIGTLRFGARYSIFSVWIESCCEKYF